MEQTEFKTEYLGDHIWLYPAKIPVEICEATIHQFDNYEKLGFTYSRPDNESLSLKDNSINLANFTRNQEEYPFQGGEIVPFLTDTLKYECLPHYETQYSLNASDELGVFEGKIQKTRPTEGYHVWHWERDKKYSLRVLAWSIFLNDVEDGGEMEFRQQSLRVTPKQGDILIWPAGFTHTHRGNPPLKSNKYIVTGWINYV